ncbi:MAG: hypothetical protein RL685_4786 [Pseudomonadota bacterium]
MTKLVLPPRPGRPVAVRGASSSSAATSVAATSASATSSAVARSSEEPRTGVVRKAVLPEANNSSASGFRPRLKLRRARAWRCLEADPRQPERSSHEALVSTAQLTFLGERLRHNGPHEWLPDATEFVHRASHLIARGLGFELCRSVCLQGSAAVFSVSSAGCTTVVGVAGPARPLSNVLRERGLR